MMYNKETGKFVEFVRDVPPFLIAVSDGSRTYLDLKENYTPVAKTTRGYTEDYPDAVEGIEKTNEPI